MSMTGTSKREQEITDRFNIYSETELLNLKDNVANAVVNALFLVPGNLPSMPNVGVDITQYFYTEITDATSSKVESDLKTACGYLPGGASIQKVVFDTVTSDDGQPVFALMIQITFPEGDSVLGISMVDDPVSKYVRFNFDYVDM